jgi:hypothetical protein
MRDGLSPWCIICRKIHERGYRDNDISKAIAADRSKQWHEDNKEKHNAQNKRWATNNRNRMNELQREWNKCNKNKIAYYAAQRRATKLQQTPKWLTDEHTTQIKQIYLTCPKGYHVDHIIPLKGKDKRGLHVPWNLQHLPASENIKKGNK